MLDGENLFPTAELWPSVLEHVIVLAADRGARVINLSIGDPTHPYHPPAPSGIAAVLDKLARERNLVIVCSSGNVSPFEYSGPTYAKGLLESDQTGLAPPAMSALALTVGALVPYSHQGVRAAQESVALQQMGKPGEPSPASRTGPGIENAVKP